MRLADVSAMAVKQWMDKLPFGAASKARTRNMVSKLLELAMLWEYIPVVAVREELRANGALSREDHSIRVLIQRQDMTGADRAWANHYDIGDVVRYAHGSKAAGIEAGHYGTVAGVNPSENLLTVEKESGESITYDPRRLTCVSVYRELERGFSVGDRIQFTAPDKSLGVANRDLTSCTASNAFA